MTDPRPPDPRDPAPSDEHRGPGTVSTAEPPSGSPPEPARAPVPAAEEATPEIEVVESEPELATVAPDEADTVELAVSDLQAAARAAGIAVEPDAEHADDPDSEEARAGDGTPELDASGSPIDPRIRERRVAVTRAQGRRRLRIVLAVVAVASAVGIAWLVVNSPFLAVNTVSIEGTVRENPDAVRTAAGVGDGDALLFVDTAAVARRIEALPWIADATVKRELPDAVRITVVERLPIAWVRRPPPPGSPRGAEGPAALVDASGRLLGDELLPPVGLPEIAGTLRIGLPGTRISPAGPARAIALLPEALRAQVGSLANRRGQAVLFLAAPPGGAEPAADEVRLGRLEEVVAKGAAALAVLDQLASEDARVGYVDVRVPSAPATR